jgi:hypothetical protein
LDRRLTITSVPVESPEDLYGLPLDRFVPSRTALVKALRVEKRREEASEVAALRKPSVAAWAVNQLVRTQPEALRGLFGAGDDLARTQAQAAAGKGGGDAMRDASRRQRDVLSELLAAAEGLLSSQGQALTQATMERVAETLRAAANDPDARQQVAGGCLTRELRFVGVGIGELAPASVKRERGAEPIPANKKAHGRGSDMHHTGKREKRKANDETAADAREAEAARKAEAGRAASREREAALKAARLTGAEAGRAATRAQKELAAAQVRHEAAATSLQEAERLLAVAVRRAEAAAAKLTAADQVLRDLGQR